MLTETQQTLIFNKTVPIIEADLVAKGLDARSAQALAVEVVLNYIIEAQDELLPTLPRHSYGIKIGEGVGTINLFLTFEPNTTIV